MGNQAPLCVRCGYPARGLQTTHDTACPECGSNRTCCTDDAGSISETIAGLLSPRSALLGALARSDRYLWPTVRNLAIACVLASAVIIWTWLIDPIRAALSEPVSAVTTLFHLMLVLSCLLLVVCGAALAFEHAAVVIGVRLLRLAQPGRMASRVSSISALSLAVIAGLTLAIVGAAQLTGLDDAIANALPAGGLAAGVASWLRTALAGFWTAGLLRDAMW